MNRRIRLLPATLCLAPPPAHHGSSLCRRARARHSLTTQPPTSQRPKRAGAVRSIAAVLSISGNARQPSASREARCAVSKPPHGFGSNSRRLAEPSSCTSRSARTRDARPAARGPRASRRAPRRDPRGARRRVIGPDDLRTIVAGCGFARPATAGRTFDSRWAAVDVDGATSWLQQVDGAWQLGRLGAKGSRCSLRRFQAGRPSTIRLRAHPTARRAGLHRDRPHHPAVAGRRQRAARCGRVPSRRARRSHADDAAAAARGGAPWPVRRRPKRAARARPGATRRSTSICACSARGLTGITSCAPYSSRWRCTTRCSAWHGQGRSC